MQNITFQISVPDSTDQVYLIGGHKKLGNWNHSKAVKLKSVNNALFSTTVRLPKGKTIEFKFTRGDWDKEALDKYLSIPQNHSIMVGEQDTINFTIYSWKDWRSFPLDQVTGNLIVHENMYSPQLDNFRTVLVWLPPSYEINEDKKYPVLYLHDGQNVFSPGFSLSSEEWKLDETVSQLIEVEKIEEIIMVAIYHGNDRTKEYSPKHNGGKYSDFIIETIKPMIDQSYRTKIEREYTAVLGSSMGGIISFHLGWEYNNVFSMAGCLSPAFLVDKNEIVKRVQESKEKPNFRFTIQNGTEDLEAKFQPSINKMIQYLNNKGYKEGNDYLYKIYNGDSHTESAWSKQVIDTLLFFFSI
jgi:predicted alpha/beta superfamily hydrolase|tara:strand:+ start:509 stop:1576 length:1068 start_codon:yes stop_codon:yes gene_type:complete